MEVKVKHELDELARDLELTPQETMAAHVRAVNRTLFTLRKEEAAMASESLPGVKIGTIKARMLLARATKRQPGGYLQLGSGRFRLFGNFASAGRRGGVTMRRPPWRIEALDGTPITAQDLRRAFIARSKAGAAHVWVRVGARRYPITALVAPSLSAHALAKGGADVLQTRGRERYLVVLEQETKYQVLTRTPSRMD